MVPRIALINIVLALAAGFFLYKTVQVWQGDVLSLPKPVLETAGLPSKGGDQAGKLATKTQAAPKSAYREITEKNLFAVDRKEYQPVVVEEETVVTETPKIDGRKITLFGVMRVDDQQSALISNPEAKGEDRKTLWVKTGDRVGNLKVEAIADQSVLFADGSKKYQVDLYDQSKRRKGNVTVQNDTPVVVNTQAEKKMAPAPKAMAEPSEKTQSDDEYEFISTPFGVAKRKKK